MVKAIRTFNKALGGRFCACRSKRHRETIYEPQNCFDHRCTGEGGGYLVELRRAKGYDVHGVKRRSSPFNSAQVDHAF